MKPEARAILCEAIREGLDNAEALRLLKPDDIATTILDAVERREGIAVYMRRAQVPGGRIRCACGARFTPTGGEHARCPECLAAQHAAAERAGGVS